MTRNNGTPKGSGLLAAVPTLRFLFVVAAALCTIAAWYNGNHWGAAVVVFAGACAIAGGQSVAMLTGILLPFLPLFSDWTTLAVACLLAAATPVVHIPGKPFLALLWIDALVQSRELLLTVFQFPESAAAFVQGGSPPGIDALSCALRCTVGAALIARSWTQTGWARDLLRGVGLSTVALSAITLLDAGGVFPWTLPSRTPFWTSIGRTGGTLTDPNALGVYLALALPVTLSWTLEGASGSRRILRSAIPILLLVAAGLYSGSRTFILGIGVYCFLAASGLHRMMMAAGVALVVAVVSLFEFGTFVELPRGLERALQTISVQQAPEALFSRSVFGSIAAAIVFDHPLTGVGVQRFREHVEPYAKALEIPLGGWTDNSNNYYFGIVAELGFIGLFVFLLCLVPFRRNKSADPHVARMWRGAVALAVMLLTGPHIDFTEVMVLSAVIVGSAFEPSCVTENGWGSLMHVISKTFVWVVAPIAIFAAAAARDSGLYGWEREGGSTFRWSTTSAFFTVPCDAPWALRAPQARPGKAVTVSVKSGRSTEEEVILTNAERRAIEPNCFRGAGRTFVRIQSDPPFRAPGDPRWLGVQVFSRR